MNIDEYLDVIHHFPTDGNKVYIRQMSAYTGDEIGTHRHEYEHYSILAAGSVVIDVDGIEKNLTGPCVLQIEAHREHKITCLTNVSWFCIHGTEETDESRIDEVLIGRG